MSRLVSGGVLAGIGWVMIALGAFLAVRPLFTHGAVTGTPLLDVAFALFFVLRGVMNVRKARQVR